MKHLLIILLLTSCTSELFITKKYIGKVVNIYDNCVITSQGYFYLTDKANPPDTAYCYLRYVEKRISGSCGTCYVLYFTWEGTDSLYLIRQNPFTGEIF